MRNGGRRHASVGSRIGSSSPTSLVPTGRAGAATFRSLLFADGSQGTRSSPRPVYGGTILMRTHPQPKIQADHVRRQAVVYIRQSSVQQVRGNRESTARQYALAEQAKALGWSAKAVQIIDEDQGRSGSSAEHRQGFKKLLAEIGAGQVGIVFALEASRLARSSVDWHRLVEICVVTQTLLRDEAAVYDPRDPHDRRLPRGKGTIS